MPPDGVLAVDLGGTQMRAAVVDERGRVSNRRACPTPHDDPDVSALVELARTSNITGLSTAVVAVPGRVDYTTGHLEHAPNLPHIWKDMLRADYLSEALGISVHLANDADAGAVGETYFGAGIDKQDVCYVTVSTGVGAGVVLQRRLVHGLRSGGEVGHVMIGPTVSDDEVSMTVEECASGSALDRDAAELGMSDGARLLAAVQAGDPDARDAWDRMVRILGTTVANLAHLFMPELVVVGGGLGINAGALLLEPLADLVDRWGPTELPRPIEFASAALGDDSVLVGCSAWHEAIG